MTQYIIRRLILMIPVVWIVTLILFALLRLTPGDPVQIEFGLEVEQESIAARKHELGLDRPIYIQYADWLGRMLTGDFGRSLRARQPVGDLIKERLPATLELAVLAFALGLIIAIPLGTLAAFYRDSFFAKAVTFITLSSIAVPGFFFSTMLVFFFTYKWRIVETPQYVPFNEDPIANLRNIILPVIALSHVTVAIYTRYIRSSMLEVLGQDYIRTARSKGLTDWVVVMRHGLRNAMIPAVTLIGLGVALLWEGAVVTERIFNWPGVGRLAFTALTNKDYPLTQAIVFVSAITVTLGNLLVDIAYAYLDPRINYVGRR